MFVGDLIGKRALHSPNALALVDASLPTHPHYTYAQLDERANRLAYWLRFEVGVQKGDRVAILAHNSVAYLDAFFACCKIGAILTCLNWRLRWQETLELIHYTQPRVLCFSTDFMDAVLHISDLASCLEEFVNLDATHANDEDIFTPYHDLLSSVPHFAVLEDSLTDEDTACLLFSGGTLHPPKPVRITHRMMAWNVLNTVLHDLRVGDVTVNVFPMFHTGGLLAHTLPLLILGGTVVLPRKFDASQVLDLLERYHCTVFAAVPTVYQRMLETPNWHTASLSHLRYAVNGGAPLQDEIIARYQREKGVTFRQGFGTTEFGPGAFTLESETATPPNSIGRPTFFTDARVVDGDNHPLPPHHVGELVVRGGAVSGGIYPSDVEPLDEQGWFHTGERAYYDEAFYFYLLTEEGVSTPQHVSPSK